MAATVIFKLKEPQGNIRPAAQRETPVIMYFSYGYTTITMDGKKRYLPLKYSTGEKIKPCYWKDRPVYRAKQTGNFDYQNFNTWLDNVEGAAKKIFRTERNAGRMPTPDQLRDLLSIELKRKSAKAQLSLNEYIKFFLAGVKSGTIETEKKTKFSHDTVRSLVGFQQQFDHYQNEKKRILDYADINQDFYSDWVRWFNEKNYSPNTVGKHLKSLKMVMHRAKNEGLHNSIEVDRKSFKIINVKVQEIYLTEADIQLLTKIDLSKNKPFDDIRNVFLVGCFTCQRFSDYSKIRKENIRTLTSGRKVIDLIQQKTGERVIVPVRPELEKILKKYKYEIPKVLEQKVNKHIKTIALSAGIKEKIMIEQVRGGLKVEKTIVKADLIKTHTARRSGATNLYLAGISTIDIMKLTGHKTEKEFLKYVNVTKEETANNLLKHSYFNKHLKVAK